MCCVIDHTIFEWPNVYNSGPFWQIITKLFILNKVSANSFVKIAIFWQILFIAVLINLQAPANYSGVIIIKLPLYSFKSIMLIKSLLFLHKEISIFSLVQPHRQYEDSVINPSLFCSLTLTQVIINTCFNKLFCGKLVKLLFPFSSLTVLFFLSILFLLFKKGLINKTSLFSLTTYKLEFLFLLRIFKWVIKAFHVAKWQ